MQEQERSEPDDIVVAEFMLRVARVPASAQLPDPAYVWCRAGLLYGPPNRRRALRLVTLIECAEVAACLTAAVALVYVSWETLRNLPMG